MTLKKDQEPTQLIQKEMFFQGKRVVITGGASGIGLALAEQLSQLGAQVSVIDISSTIQLPKKATLISADVADQSVLRTQIALKNVDLLIIAAGVTSETNNPTTQEQELMEAVNVRGVENTLEVFRSLLNKNAQIVFIGSDDPPKAYYAETKKRAAELVKEFSEKHPDVTTQVVYLGPVRTPLFEKGKPPEVIQRIQDKVGLYEPSELAEELIDSLVNKPHNQGGLYEEVMYKKLEPNI